MKNICYKEVIILKLFVVVVLSILFGCANETATIEKKKIDTTGIIENKIPAMALVSEDSVKTEFDGESVYPGKAYKIRLVLFDSLNNDEETPNTLFIVSRNINGTNRTIFTDSIYCSEQDLKFEDFNADKIPDILINYFSDVRSNWTYHLYLVDTVSDSFKKIKGFEEIKNPEYLPKYNLIDNYVLSGRNWTSFYQITGDTIREFDHEIEDNQNDDSSYEKQYKKALEAVLKEKNN